MIVVDTNVIGYLYLNVERSNQMEQVLSKDSQWAAPLLWRSEFRNVLAIQMRKHLLDLSVAQTIMAESVALLAGREYEVNSSVVLTLAARSPCSAYDCEFIALAQDLGVRLVTVDKQVLEQFSDVAVSPEAYLLRASE